MALDKRRRRLTNQNFRSKLLCFMFFVENRKMETICRFCLKTCDSFKALEEHMKNFLDKLLLKKNLAAVQKSVVCTNCAEILEKCFDFKAMCLNVHDNIAPFVNDKDSIKLDLIDMRLSRNEKGNGVPDDQEICAFCRSPIRNCSTITLHVEKGDVLLKKMIKQCLPELDLNIIKKFVICTTCRESLEMFFHFLTNCLMVEENIKKYCETLNINGTHQIELSNLLKFTIRNATSIEVDGNLIDIVKIKELCEEIENTDERKIGMGRDITLEQMSYGDSEDAKVEIKHETMEMTDLKFNNEEEFTNRSMLGCKEESDKLDGIKTEETFCEESEIKEENLVEMEDQKFLVNEEIEIKTDESDFNRSKDEGVWPQSEPTTGLRRRWKYLMSNHEEDQSKPYLKHILKNEDVSKIMYKCECCSYKTISKPSLKIHCRLHKNRPETPIHEYESCSYQTRNKYSLKSHLLVHKDPSEMIMYKCDSCLYQTNIKSRLKTHILVHKDRSEVTMYKCNSCLFQTKFKHGLKNHIVNLHKDPSEVTMYRCDSCLYQTRIKSHLKSHLLVHKHHLEVPMYHCDSCSFRTKRKRTLKTHVFLHKDSSVVTMYKCVSCSYQTTDKGNLKRHLMLHKDSSEVTMYKCDSCSYQSKQKSVLKMHLLGHKSPSEVTMFKCYYCSYLTKFKSHLKSHLLVHKDRSEVTMYKCDSCSFQTKRKFTLKTHLLVHKDRLEVAMYKCNTCSFRTKRKRTLETHILAHKDLTEVTM